MATGPAHAGHLYTCCQRPVLIAAAALMIAAAAHAVPIVKIADVQTDSEIISIPVTISGAAPGTIQSFIASIVVEAGAITRLDARTGTVWATSSLPQEPYYGDLGGNPVPAGHPSAVLGYLDYGMPPGTPSGNLPQVTEGLLLTIVVVAPWPFETFYPHKVSFSTDADPFGAPDFSLTSGPMPVFINGSFMITIPEPTSLLLLAAGVRFVRRRGPRASGRIAGHLAA